MADAEVKPDAQTFSYLLGNCSSEEDITKVLTRIGIEAYSFVLHAKKNNI
jgi:hypothetical protein